jgi:hypothetical protein
MFSIRIKPFLATLVACAIGLAFLPSSADAAFKLRLTDNLGNTITITDDGAGDESATTAGVITFTDPTGIFPGFFVNVNVGLSKPTIPNTASTASMDLTNTSVRSSGASTLTVELTDTSFSLVPASGGNYILISSPTGNLTNATMTFQSIVDMTAGGTVEFTAPGAVNGTTVVSTGVQSSFTAASLTFPGTSPFSMTQILNVSFAGVGSLNSFDGKTTVTTPAPAGLLLALSGLPALGIGYCFRRKKRLA